MKKLLLSIGVLMSCGSLLAMDAVLQELPEGVDYSDLDAHAISQNGRNRLGWIGCAYAGKGYNEVTAGNGSAEKLRACVTCVEGASPSPNAPVKIDDLITICATCLGDASCYSSHIKQTKAPSTATAATAGDKKTEAKKEECKKERGASDKCVKERGHSKCQNDLLALTKCEQKGKKVEPKKFELKQHDPKKYETKTAKKKK